MSIDVIACSIVLMLNIKQEIQILLLKCGLSMRKLIEKMNEQGYKMPASSGLSVMFSRKRVRFETIQEILDFLGYELQIVKKKG